MYGRLSCLLLFQFHSFHLILDASCILGHISLTSSITVQPKQEHILSSPRIGDGVTQFCHLEFSPKTEKGTRPRTCRSRHGVGVARKRRGRCLFGVPQLEGAGWNFMDKCSMFSFLGGIIPQCVLKYSPGSSVEGVAPAPSSHSVHEEPVTGFLLPCSFSPFPHFGFLESPPFPPETTCMLIFVSGSVFRITQTSTTSRTCKLLIMGFVITLLYKVK